jgi:hypothetical protein
MASGVVCNLNKAQATGLFTRAICIMDQFHDKVELDVVHDDDDDEMHILQYILAMFNVCVENMKDVTSLSVINTPADAMTALKIPLKMLYCDRRTIPGQEPTLFPVPPALLYDMRFFIRFLLKNFFTIIVHEEAKRDHPSFKISVRKWLQEQSMGNRKDCHPKDRRGRNHDVGDVGGVRDADITVGRNGFPISLSPQKAFWNQEATTTPTEWDNLLFLLDRYGKDLIRETLNCLPPVNLVNVDSGMNGGTGKSNEVSLLSEDEMDRDGTDKQGEECTSEDQNDKKYQTLTTTTQLLDLAVDFLHVMESEPILSCSSSPFCDDSRKLWCAVCEFALYKINESDNEDKSQVCHKIITDSMRRLVDSQLASTDTYESIIVISTFTTNHGANLNNFEQSMIVNTAFRLLVGASIKEEWSAININKEWVAGLLDTRRYGVFLKTILRSSVFLSFCSPLECDTEEGKEPNYYHLLELAGLEDEETELDKEDPNYDPFHSYILDSLLE